MAQEQRRVELQVHQTPELSVRRRAEVHPLALLYTVATPHLTVQLYSYRGYSCTVPYFEVRSTAVETLEPGGELSELSQPGRR